MLKGPKLFGSHLMIVTYNNRLQLRKYKQWASPQALLMIGRFKSNVRTKQSINYVFQQSSTHHVRTSQHLMLIYIITPSVIF